MADINLSPYTVEQQAIDRRRRMAELLQQQTAAPMEMPSVPGVRSSPFSGLAKLLQGYGAGQTLKNIDTEQQALGQKYQTERTNQFQDLARLLSAPAQAAQPAIEPAFVEGQSTITQGGQAAVPARPAGYLPAEALSQFTHPEINQLAMSKYLAQLEPKPLLHGKEGDVFFNQAGEEVRRIPKAPNWENFSKFDEKTGAEIKGLINKNAPNPLETFVEGARKPEDLVSVDTTNEQGQPVTRYLKKSDPLLTSGVPKPLVGILGDLQMAGALPSNWKDNPAIVDLVNTSFINKVGGITPKDVFNFKVAVADLGIKKATLADQGINAGVAIPPVPMQSTGVLGAIQNRPVSQPAPVITPTGTSAVAPAKANRQYTPLNAPQPAVSTPAAEPSATSTGLSPRDMREIEKQKILSANKDMTETQSNAALFGGSMAQAHATMNQLEKAGTVKNAVIPAMMQSLVGLVPLGVGEKVADQIESIAKTDPTGMFGPDQNQQRLGQAQVAFATAWLRKTSGASFGAAEVANTIKEFFPMRGEGDSVIKQKREARDRAIEGMKLGTTKEGQAYIDRYLGAQPKASGTWKVVK